ncbi:MAG: type II toxin-antitoxin system RelE/ParE family toxin [Methyloprofundus sp.]|nr:type II toxin-antitoxin system RelE/ParE family toxin [Methyloprofundus sp.]
MKNFPNLPNCKKLTNFEPAYRLCSGDYRILFDVNDNEIEIGRILHRKESY